MLHWSQNKELLRWAILTKCGKDRYTDLVRGSKHPTEIPCCGLEPKDPNKTDNMVLRTNSIIVTEFQKEDVNQMNEPNDSMIETTEQIETVEPTQKKPKSSKTVEWPDKQELSNLVNSQSMRSLSKELNTSVNNIKKHCKELEITIPAMKFNWSKP